MLGAGVANRSCNNRTATGGNTSLCLLVGSQDIRCANIRHVNTLEANEIPPVKVPNRQPQVCPSTTVSGVNIVNCDRGRQDGGRGGAGAFQSLCYGPGCGPA
jgi:hypothetical protein